MKKYSILLASLMLALSFSTTACDDSDDDLDGDITDDGGNTKVDLTEDINKACEKMVDCTKDFPMISMTVDMCKMQYGSTNIPEKCASKAKKAYECMASESCETLLMGTTCQVELQNCLNGANQDSSDSCKENETKCDGDRIKKCVSGKWQTTDCESGQKCQNNECKPVSSDNPGTQNECDASFKAVCDGDKLKECVSGKYQYTTCGGGCENNKCVACKSDMAPTCAISNKVQKCVDGNLVSEKCGSSTVCVSGECVDNSFIADACDHAQTCEMSELLKCGDGSYNAYSLAVLMPSSTVSKLSDCKQYTSLSSKCSSEHKKYIECRSKVACSQYAVCHDDAQNPCKAEYDAYIACNSK